MWRSGAVGRELIAGPPTGVEDVAQPVAEQVEPEHGERDRRAGEDRSRGATKSSSWDSWSIRPHDGVGGGVPSRGRTAPPPRGRRWRRRDRRLDDDEAGDIRQDVPHADRDGTTPGHPSGQDVPWRITCSARYGSPGRSSGSTRCRSPPSPRVEAPYGTEHDGEQQRGKARSRSEPRMSGSSTYRGAIAETMPSGTPTAAATPDGDEADEEGGPRPHEDLREDVPAELVGAERVAPRRGEQPRARVDEGRVVWRPDMGHRGHEDDGADDDRADDEAGVGEQAGPHRTSPVRSRGRSRGGEQVDR